MRITQQMLTRNYLSRMNTNLSNLTKSNEKLSSGRSFNKAWENVPDAGKSLKIRQLIVDNERYQVTIRDAEGRAAAAEDNVRNVNALMIRAKESLVAGLNGTMSPSDREKIATELDKAKEEIMQVMNGQFSNKYLFSASGNVGGEAPFAVDDIGNLTYNGTVVDTMVKNNGDPSILNADGTYSVIPWNADNYVDIGAGYLLNSEGKVDPNTGYKDTYSGVESFGYGVNSDGVPLNAWSLFDRMVTDLNNNDMESLGKALNGIEDSMEFMLTSITDIGARGVTLEDTATRLEEEYVNLVETQSKLEGVDVANEIIHNKEDENSWLVTLQLGSKILPQTIFDFLR